jgi:outer membrane protein OmpA-like peptidoglycan-associated protein
VTFGPRSTALTAKAKVTLLSLARRTKATATGGVVIGYVQRDGIRANNTTLSKRRALAIVRFLKAHGVKVPLTTRGHGALTTKTTGRMATIRVSYRG